MISEPIWISAIEHWEYCERQCMLIHKEQLWMENNSTTKGTLAHGVVDQRSSRSQPGRTLYHSVHVWSDRLNVLGICDVVERDMRTGEIYPVEHKSGSVYTQSAVLQLAAQAMCLEEDLDTTISKGFIFLTSARHRYEVDLSSLALRHDVECVVRSINEAMSSKEMPPAVNDKRCRDCSLLDYCMPELTANPKSSLALARSIFRA